MAEIGTAYVSLIPSAKGFGAAVSKEVGGAGTPAGATASKGFKGAFTKGLAGLGGAMVGIFAISKVKDFFTSAVGEARESQKVSAITAQVIKSTGGAAQVSAKQVGDLATAISNKTGIDDEAVQSASNLLLTFKNLRNETGKGNDVFDQATQAATDMGAALGKEPRGAAIQLGKALNDPTKGISALSRAGVTFNATQAAMIKKLQEGGDNLGAQKIILKELKSEFGGTAAASATAGEKAATSFNNLKEQIGTALLPTIDKLEGILSDDVIPAVSTFLTQMQNGKGAGGQFADALQRVWDVVKGLWTVLEPVGKFLINHLPIVLAVAAAYLVWQAALLAYNIVQAIQLAMLMIVTPGTFLYSVAAGVSAVATGLWAAATWLLMTPLGLVVLAVIALIVVVILVIKYHRQIGAFIGKVWGKVKDAIVKAVTAAVNWVKARFSGLVGWIKTVPGKVAAGLRNMWEGAKNAWLSFNAFIHDRLASLVAFILTLPGKIASLAGKLLGVGKSIGSGLINGIMAGIKAVGGVVSDLVGSIKTAINSALHLPFTIKGPGPLPDFTIPSFATGGRARGSIVEVGDGGWESIVPDHLMVQALATAAKAGAGSGGQLRDSGTANRNLRLVVDGYEFNAYVDARADDRVASSNDMDNQRGRAAWR